MCAQSADAPPATILAPGAKPPREDEDAAPLIPR